MYHGVENILKQELLAVGVPLPSGAAWHRDLLQSACEHRIVSTELRNQLVPYMAFRHFFTHAYGFDLDPRRLAPLIRDVRAVYACFKQEVNRFVSVQATRGHASKSQAEPTKGSRLKSRRNLRSEPA